jgi:hypothetical protein
MTTVAQMIEWLKTLPQDAEVECVEPDPVSYSNYMVMCSVDIESCHVHDYTSEQWKEYPHFYGRTVVEIRGD